MACNPSNDSGFCATPGDAQNTTEISIPGAGRGRGRGQPPNTPLRPILPLFIDTDLANEDGDQQRSPGNYGSGGGSSPSSTGALSPGSTRGPMSPQRRREPFQSPPIRLSPNDSYHGLSDGSTGTYCHTPQRRSIPSQESGSPYIPEPNYEIEDPYDDLPDFGSHDLNLAQPSSLDNRSLDLNLSQDSSSSSDGGIIDLNLSEPSTPGILDLNISGPLSEFDFDGLDSP